MANVVLTDGCYQNNKLLQSDINKAVRVMFKAFANEVDPELHTYDVLHYVLNEMDEFARMAIALDLKEFFNERDE